MINGKRAGFGKEMPPAPEHVVIYFIQKGLTEQNAAAFYEAHQAGQWRTIRGRPIRNWKAVAADYVWELLQQRKQRMRKKSDYGDTNVQPGKTS